MSVRLDSLEESKDHRLASCLSVKAKDFFVAETISNNRPVKMVGEWFNDDEHPRDSNDGLFMMKVSRNNLSSFVQRKMFGVANSCRFLAKDYQSASKLSCHGQE